MLSAAKPLLIAQISDCHLYADTQKTGYNNVNPYLSLSAVLKQLAQYKPDCVVVSGDITNDYSQQSYWHLQQLCAEYLGHTPLHLLPGNHDDIAAMQTVFSAKELWHRGPVTYGNWHLHCLSSKTDNKSGEVSAQQLAQTCDYIQQYLHQHHVVALHHHPIPCHGWMDKYPLINAEEFLNQVSHLSSVKALIHGHIHTAIEQQVNEVSIFSCPSSCWQWATQAEFAFSEEWPGFRLLNCFADGRLTTEVIRVSLLR
ncbi:metallophosphoesterase [Alteromonadaceae bacterium BrNp21-10]|nr:metallophosphoesterase [Alteromonadaceae bacterium BrNp21-10]